MDDTSGLVQFAADQQRRFDSATAPRERKKEGHFGTPAPIANYMAGMFTDIPRGKVRILDPGAGVGTLSAAVCERVLGVKSSLHLEIELWEANPGLVPFLRRTMDCCRTALTAAGHKLDYTVCLGDFILANTRKTMFEDGPGPSFHLSILNPPYYKVRKESPQAKAMAHVVHGQPNIYAFFLAVTADLLLPGGQLVAITPRSYFNGQYFRRFRKWFFDRMTARHIHVFESRTELFTDDGVLQENVILLAEKGGEPKEVTLTASRGRDVRAVNRSTVPYDRMIDDSNGDHVVRVTTSIFEHEVVAALDAFPRRFRDLGFEISTGPVVSFRSTEYLQHERSKDTAPLLWMHNVRPFVTRFPLGNGKPGHILLEAGSKRLLVPAKRYVLLKRFSAKEEKRRLVAGIMEPTDSYSEWVGLENHLNYVYRPGAELDRVEAVGLAAYFNSALVDRYFRAISGNTQVNATEVRTMPVPDERLLAWIGQEVERTEDRSPRTVERIVGRALRLPERLVEELCEGSQ
ncbi:MAG: Eco57I restriction-modification methylase domain-containing protein [Zavarzinella sp.]|nr:Eco57I restriction-modification methylase domain-containing protein [Zavarzinella sp.]